MQNLFITPGQRKLIIPEGSNVTTFIHESGLPKLPVPKLDETLQKYIESVKPFATLTEFENTKQLCQDFLQNEGPTLQARLHQLHATKGMKYTR